jgi:CheY-like chemotaxis protein
MDKKTAPVLVAEDAKGDQLLYDMAFKELGISNTVKFFENGKDVLDFLLVSENLPFIILCDINMPVMNGIELKEQIEADTVLQLLSIPFIFMSSSTSPYDKHRAFSLKPQGYFQKTNTLDELVENLRIILQYWGASYLPSVH